MSVRILDRPDVQLAVEPSLRDVVRSARRGTARRHRLVVTGLAVLVLGAFLVRVLLGDFTVTIPDFVRILTGAQIPGATFIVMETKLPRAVLGVLVGAAFGLGGAIFQTTLRNALASPDIIGVSLGASAAAVFAIVTLGLQGPAVSGFAVAGALGVSLVVRLVAGAHGGYRIVLVGVGSAAFLSAVIQYLFTRASIYDAQAALVWLTGSLARANWALITQLVIALVVLLPVVAWLAGSLRLTELGPDTATALGAAPRGRDGLLLLAVLLVSVAVAAAGPVSFAGFLAGPIAKTLNAGRATLLGAMLTGAALVTSADYVGAYLIADLNLPVGVVTGACGAPFLLWLLATGRTTRST
ncbi:iron complex transport system permease protein [Pedococcus dokdonensis]|uniref:Iron complex transport system permease protein n=1 Tax=Pedococcus dokdonensis TaxID=443156 RepID=A0A1H0V1G6_9MICO|nr:iron chelate uptake ABC transporter family permease subunit [Pedococcus dokdonensis]SDP72399.1 iron complex transport system permease protein [Pedococcus dokdonensis]